MQAHSARLTNIRNLASVLTALSFLIVVISAYIRLSGAGLGCAGWPDCYGQVLAGGPHPQVAALRILHRIVAVLSIALAFFTTWQCLRPDPIQPVARYATWLLALMIVLMLVGVWSSDPHRAWASFINMLGGLGLVALSWRMVVAADAGPARPRPPHAGFMLRAGLAALVMALALGALIGARFAAIACSSVPNCAGAWWPPAEGWATLTPFATVAVLPLPGDAGGVTLHLLHRYCAAAAMLLLGIAGLRALAAAATRGAGRWLLILLVAEFALGSLTVLSGFNLWLAAAHSVCAAALLAVGMQVMMRAKAAPA